MDKNLRSQQLKPEMLRRLMDYRSGRAEYVSIYIPTHPKSRSDSLNEDQIRYKNAYRKALRQLKAGGIRLAERQKLQAQFEDLEQELSFWQSRDRGTAIFTSNSDMAIFDIPIELEPLMYVGQSFVTFPAWLVNSINAQHYVLSLSLNQPKLYKASEYYFQAVEVENMPGPIKTALRIEDFEKELQFHSARSSRGSARFHGHGGSDDTDSEVANYLRLVEKAVHEGHLRGQNIPLILAGTPRVVARFKSLASYKNIAAGYIQGNFDQAEEKLETKHRVYWRQQLREHSDHLVENTMNRGPRMLAKVNLPSQLNEQATSGRIDLLINRTVEHTRDSVRDGRRKVVKLKLPDTKGKIAANELLHRNVINQGGEVQAVLDSVPGNFKFLAKFRY